MGPVSPRSYQPSHSQFGNESVSQLAELFKALPAVDKLLQHPALVALSANYGLSSVKAEIRFQLDQLRSGIATGDEQLQDSVRSPDFVEALVRTVEENVSEHFSSSLVPVFNLTGTVIHTNLGRATLPHEALSAMEVAALQATNLEYDLETGSRGDRDAHIESRLCELCGAEAATVVNNNAAAVLLVLHTLASNRQVLISRGELVEIGGSFRIPDVMVSAGCSLKEVGTTNRTHLKDFENALDDNSALIMRVHTSNYEIRGFTQAVAPDSLSELAHKHGIPFVSDLGSGTLVDLSQFGLQKEPTVADELAQGADLVTFSGDKLLGGPQAGVIVGDAALVAKIKANPLKRALRIDKITMAALAEVLNLYRDPDRLQQRLPVLRDMTRPEAEILQLAQSILPAVQKAFSSTFQVSIQACKSQIGSGSLPAELLPSHALAFIPVAKKGQRDAELLRLSDSLRKLPKPVIGRIHDGRLLLDLRCLRDEEGFLEQVKQLS